MPPLIQEILKEFDEEMTLAQFGFGEANVKRLKELLSTRLQQVYLAGKKKTIDSFERWGKSRMKNYEESELMGKVETLKATLTNPN